MHKTHLMILAIALSGSITAQVTPLNATNDLAALIAIANTLERCNALPKNSAKKMYQCMRRETESKPDILPRMIHIGQYRSALKTVRTNSEKQIAILESEHSSNDAIQAQIALHNQVIESISKALAVLEKEPDDE